MSPRLLTLSTALACALGLATATAGAQAPSADDAADAARSQYNAGTKAFADQRYAEAALAFEAAADVKPSAWRSFTAALSWDKTNAPDRAADDYARALALPGLPADKTATGEGSPGAARVDAGRDHVSGADGARVQLDGNSRATVARHPSWVVRGPHPHGARARAPHRPATPSCSSEARR